MKKLSLSRIAVVGMVFALAFGGCSMEDLPPDGGAILRAPATTGVILGKLELEGLGACAGVAVEIDGPSGLQEIVTAGGGTFRVEGLSAGAYAVRARAEGYATVEEVFVYDAVEPRDVGTVAMAIERVPVRGRVKTSDGRSAAGASVSVSAEVALAPPAGVSCGEAVEGSAYGGVTALVGPDGQWAMELPAIAARLRGLVQREGYTEEPFEVAGEVLAAAAASGEAADAGELTLYPLTGFVNAVGGKYQSSRSVELQVSAFNGAGELRLGAEVDGVCDYTGSDWQAFDATPTFTAAADGEITICVGVRNDRGQEIELKTDVVVDTTAPTGVQATVGSGSGLLRLGTVNVAVSAIETGSGLSTVRIDDNGTPGAWQPYGSVVPHTFVGGEGSHTLEMYVRDRAGNESVAVTEVVIYDGTSPVFAATRSAVGRTVRVTFTSLTDVSPLEYRVGWDGPGTSDLAIASAPWQPLGGSAPAVVTTQLPAVDGEYTVSVQLRDAAGNLSTVEQLLPTITIDENPPENLGFSIVEAATTDGDITLRVRATDTGGGTLTVQVSENGNFGSPSHSFSYVSGTGDVDEPYTLSSTIEGMQIVYVRFCDGSQNCTGALSDTVQLDTTPPSNPFVAVRSGAYATSPAITLDLFASGADEVAIQVGSSDFSAATWLGYAPEKAYVLTGGDGAKTIYVRYRDLAGNLSPITSTTVTLDTTAPNTPTVTLAGGAMSTGERLVEVALSGYTPESGLEMRIAENPSFTGTVWQPVASVFTQTLSAGDGAKTVYVRLRDAAGNLSGVGNDGILLDQSGPTGLSFGIVGSPVAVSTATISLNLGANDAAGQVTAQVANNLGFVDATDYVFASGSVVTSYTLAGSDGYRTLYARFCDAAGNCEGPLSAAVTLDRVAPDGEDMFLQGGGNSASNATVTLVLAANGADEMAIVQDAPVFGSGDWQTYRTQRAFTLTGGDGAKTIYVRYRDLAGNLSGIASLPINLDTTGPVPGGVPIVINGGDPGTSVRTVSLTIDAGDADEMQVSESATFAGASWEAAAASRAFELSPGDGVKTVYVRFRDTAGNTTGSYNDTIALDTTPPTGATLAIVGNPNAVSTTTVSLTLSATGASTVELADNSAFTGASTFAYTTATTTTLSSGDGLKTVYARYCDDAGNCSAGVGVSVILDTTPPSGGLLINNGAASTTSRSATLTISGSDTGSGIAGTRL